MAGIVSRSQKNPGIQANFGFATDSATNVLDSECCQQTLLSGAVVVVILYHRVEIPGTSQQSARGITVIKIVRIPGEGERDSGRKPKLFSISRMVFDLARNDCPLCHRRQVVITSMKYSLAWKFRESSMRTAAAVAF